MINSLLTKLNRNNTFLIIKRDISKLISTRNKQKNQVSLLNFSQQNCFLINSKRHFKVPKEKTYYQIYNNEKKTSFLKQVGKRIIIVEVLFLAVNYVLWIRL
jgi:hypothetical protein